MQVALAQALDELLGVDGWNRLERGHDHEGRADVPEQAAHRFGPGDEAVPHRLEQDEETSKILEELATQDPVSDLVEGP